MNDNTLYPNGANGTAVLLGSVMGDAVAIADRAVVADIETCCPLFTRLPDGSKCYDLRPMLNEHEQAPQAIDMNRQALEYARRRQLIWSPPGGDHLAVITRNT